MASLLVLTGPKKGSKLPLREGRTTLGRDKGCDIVFNEDLIGSTTRGTESVSRWHTVIFCVGGEFYIEDGNGRGKKSRNGTVVNDKQVPFPGRTRLHEGDRIRICEFGCSFHEDGEPTLSVEATLGHDSSISSLNAQPAEKLRVILEFSNDLSTALEADSLLPQILESLFRLFRQANRGFILLQDETTASPTVRAFKSRAGEGADDRFSASIVRLCLEKVQAVLGNDLTHQFPESESVNELPVRSLMCAPLWSPEGQALGAIQLDSSSVKAKFTQEDLNLLLGVASQASIALRNARLYREAVTHKLRERDLEVAREIQLALLPRELPELPGYAFAAHYEPARQLGGDYYDFVPLPGGRLAVLLGDVAGKGVPAALVMARFGVQARFCLEAEPDLAAAVSQLNTLVARAGLMDRFVTLVAVALDPATHTAQVVNAGHPSPLLIRMNTGTAEEVALPDASGLPLGIDANYIYEAHSIRLSAGDNLLLFSDGLTDAAGAQGLPFRARGIRAVLSGGTTSPRETVERLVGMVKQHASGCDQYDDMTVVCFGRTGQ